MHDFSIRPLIKFGDCSLDFLKEYRKKRIFIVTDGVIVKLNMLESILKVFETEEVDIEIFDEVEPNPTILTVEKGLEKMIYFKPDMIIAVGGGSPIDASKGILYFYLKFQEKLFEKGFTNIEKKPFFIAVPTTSGTGSEVTSYSVLTEGDKKIPLSHVEMLPDVAILNPEFIKTVPKQVVADTGMDVLTHAIESYVSQKSNPFTEPLAIEAIEIIFNNLYKHFSNPIDYIPRERIQIASCLAGIAFNNSSLGLNHSIAHSIGGKFKIPHGKINAIILPYVIEENMDIIPNKYYDISRKIGLPSRNILEGSLSFLIFVKEIRKLLGIPNTLREYGIDKEEFEEVIETIISEIKLDICTEYAPKKLDDSEYKKLLLKIYG